jgi:NADH:ubiquinone oxidoreductase subunit 5 (subunit L)/multisubunit Na+/H+ antiporter MnhA subunit
MEGPTPVSALLHAATMVTAGIFLVIRCSSLFEFAPNVLFIMVIWGTLTAFFGSTTAFFQNDIKKIIAYSTCSQLGYMLAACGMSNYYSSLFHLFTHAFFKALLFLSAGIVIHGLANEQDIRKMGGLHRIFPFAFTMFIIGSLALGGFPFLSGFYSKDAIIETSLVLQEPTLSYFIPKLLYFTAVITSMYSTRLIYLVFLARPNSNLVAVKTTSEAEKPMLLSLSILAFGSIFAGYIFKDFFVGAGTDTFNVSVFVNFYSFDKNIFREFLPQTTKNITTVGCILIALIYLVYKSTGSGLNTM